MKYVLWIFVLVTSAVMAGISYYVVALWTFFEAGGTFGGPGEPASAHLDEALAQDLMQQRMWIVAVAALVAPAITLLVQSTRRRLSHV
jgi:hypothetical protein